MSIQWFLTRDGETIAQFTTEEFKRAVAAGRIRHSDFIRRSDSSTFISAAEFLPTTYQPRSGVGRYVGSLGAAIAVAGAVLYGLSTVMPQYADQAMHGLANIGTPAMPDQNTAIRAALLSDSSSGGFFQQLALKDSAAFDDLVTHLGSLPAASEHDTVSEARRYLMKSVIEPRSRYLSDDDKVAMMTLTKDLSAHLATSNPQMCIAVAIGQPFGDIRQFMSQELIARENGLMLRMLDASPREIELLPAATLQELNKKVAVKLYEAHADQIALLDLENVPAGQEAAACQMFVAYLEGVLTLPRDESVALIRAMMSDPSRLNAEAAPADTTSTGTGSSEAVAAETASPPTESAAPDAAADADAPAATAAPAEPGDAGAAEALPETPFPEGLNQPSR